MKSVHNHPDYANILAGLQKRYRDLRQFYEVNSAVIPATRGDESRWGWTVAAGAVLGTVIGQAVIAAFSGDSAIARDFTPSADKDFDAGDDFTLAWLNGMAGGMVPQPSIAADALIEPLWNRALKEWS